MTYYYKKRRKIGLTRSEMANKLGMNYERYADIEKGEIKMPTNLIDKFNEIINKGKINDIDRLNRQKIVEDWFDELTVEKLKEKMKEFNISTYKELAELMGYTNQSSICCAINKTRVPGFDFKNKLYSFFENELNIQKPKKQTVKEKVKEIMLDQDKLELQEWYRNFDIKAWLKEHNYTIAQFSREYNLKKSPFYYFCNPPHENHTPNINTIVTIKRAIEKAEGKEIQIPVKEAVEEIVEPIEETKEINLTKDDLTSKYEYKVRILEEQVHSIRTQMEELDKQLNEIIHTRKIYEELLEELKML